MINHLAYFQFPFMYLLALVMGLVVYGSDFDSIVGWLYVALLLLIVIAHKRVWSKRWAMASGNTGTFVSVIGAVVGIWVYTPLHMDYWDEHSLGQAVGMVILGTCSYLLSVIAAAKINAHPNPCGHCAVWALIITGAAWSMAVYYPMIVVLFMVFIFIIAGLWWRPLPSVDSAKITDISAADVIARYAVFLLAIDLGCIIWDYQVNTAWASYLGVAFIAAALGYFFKSVQHSDRVEQAIYALALANFALAVLWPPYLLWMLHAIAAGFALGYLLPKAVLQSDYQSHSVFSMGWMVWFFMGLVLSNAWYANLQWAATRLVLLLPFVLLAGAYVIYRRLAIKHH
jgi:hypothetical protein